MATFTFSEYVRGQATSLRVSIQVLCHLSMLVVLALGVCACSKRYDDLPAYLPFSPSDYPNQSVGRFKTAYLADQIDQYYQGVAPGPLGIATFVNVDDLNSTSTFGRLCAEQLMSELAMRGFEVIELRHSDALQFIDASGEFALSRSPGFVRRQQTLGGIVVGTYVVSPVRVYLNARLIEPSSARVVSAGSVEMSKTNEIARLLRGGSFSGSLERIPVRHIGLTTYPWQPGTSAGLHPYDLEEGPAGAHSQRSATYVPAPPLAVLPAPKEAPKASARAKQDAHKAEPAVISRD
jgi:hypothetical protein